jgi:nicotinamidase-related amidase
MQPPTWAFFDVDTRVLDERGQSLIIGPRAATIAPQLTRLFQFAEDRHIPVVATTCVQTRPIGEALKNGVAHVRVEGDPGQALAAAEQASAVFLERRSCGDGDTNVKACVWDVFKANRHAADCIRRLKVRRWAVFGISLEYCLRGACAGLCRLGMEVVVLSDAVVPSARAECTGLADGLAVLTAAGARLATTDSFLKELAHG